MLDHAIGRYLRADALVFRGTAEGQDNQSQLDGFDGSMPRGTALASLEFDGDDAVLTVHDLDARKYVVLTQHQSQPGVTEVGQIFDELTIGGNTATCTGWAPGFSCHPKAPAFSVRRGYDVSGATVPHQITASDQLSLPAPPSRKLQALVY